MKQKTAVDARDAGPLDGLLALALPLTLVRQIDAVAAKESPPRRRSNLIRFLLVKSLEDPSWPPTSSGSDAQISTGLLLGQSQFVPVRIDSGMKRLLSLRAKLAGRPLSAFCADVLARHMVSPFNRPEPR